MHLRLKRAFLAAIAVSSLELVGCHAPEKSKDDTPMQMRSITGSVAYRVRIALPPDAVVNVRLEDVSQADGAPTLIAERSMATEGRQVPIQFTLEYDAAKIISAHRYHVQATIKTGSEVLFTTTREYPVLTHDAGSHVEILLEQSRGSGTQPDAPKSASLEDTFWRLVELDGRPALPSNGPRDAGITFVSRQGIIGANTGINSMGGEYTLDGKHLAIKPGMMTMMAGPEPLMRQEQAFVAALGRITSYRINDRSLELLAGEDVVMKFEVAQQ